MSTAAFTPGGTLRCARHPSTETVLRCGKCDTPICPRCLIGTPVGARCPTCAGVKRFSTFLKPAELARAVGYGLAVSAIGTVVLATVPLLALVGPLIGYMVIGFGVGEAVSRGVNRKRARELGPIAVACLFVGFELGLVVYLGLNGAPLGPEVLLAPIALMTRGLTSLVGLLVGALLAWMRVR